MKKLLPILATLLLLAACRQGLEYDRSPEANLDALWRVIDEKYCYHDYKARTIGLDWAAAREKYMARLHPAMSGAQLFEVMSQMLAELRDGHVNLSYSADMSRYWNWHEDYPRNLSPDVRDRYLGRDCKMAAGLKYCILPGNVGYMVYESFSQPVGHGNVEDALHYLRTCNGLILDIRGNGGGSLDNVETLCSHFARERTLVGYTQHKTGPGHNQFSDPRPQYISPTRGLRWMKRTVVLANRECYSAANEFVRNMKCLPDVTVMGDHTGGGGGMPFTSELPCGWAVRFSASPSLDALGRHIEHGIAPDIEHPLDSALLLQGRDSMIEAAEALLSLPSAR